MSYDAKVPITYSVGEIDIGDAPEVFSIQGPSGAAGILLEVSLSATETFTATTTPGYVRIGTAADPDANFEMSCATTADTDSIAAASTDYIDRVIAADTQVEVTTVAPTGGTPAGKGWIFITILWDKPYPKHDFN